MRRLGLAYGKVWEAEMLDAENKIKLITSSCLVSG